MAHQRVVSAGGVWAKAGVSTKSKEHTAMVSWDFGKLDLVEIDWVRGYLDASTRARGVNEQVDWR
jgi:hypothetical protein